MIVSIDRAWVIFVEKVTFWPRTPCVASQSHWFDPLLTHFGPCPARYIGSGRSAPKYEIDRLFEIHLGSHFWPLLPLAIPAWFSACRSDFGNVVRRSSVDSEGVKNHSQQSKSSHKRGYRTVWQLREVKTNSESDNQGSWKIPKKIDFFRNIFIQTLLINIFSRNSQKRL